MVATVAEIFETMEYGPAPESAKPAQDWLAEHERRFGLFIAGEWRKPDDSEDYFETINPATDVTLARIAQAGAADVEAAVQAARKAFPAWSQETSGSVRARYLYALARQVQKHARLFAVLETLDNGKPIRETRDSDIPLVARHFYHHAGWAQLMAEEMPGCEPLGVIGQIIPWNFPLLMLAWKIAPALAMGNTVVLKPAEFTPLTALLFAEICQRIGMPPGVVNIITGDGSTGELLVKHPQVDKIAFTGSTEVGRLIRQATAGSGKKLSLELGGKSPFLVFEDADLNSTVEGVVDAIWFNQGQVCCAGSRLLVQESIAEDFHRKLRARMETLRVGDPLDKGVDIGAIVSPVQLEKIARLVQTGVQEGATLWQPSRACPQEGCFFPPTLFTDVTPASTIAQVEIFGPVLVSMSFRTPQEAVALANNTPYGLAASIWTENINLALDVAPKIKAGTIWINSTNLFDAASGFGGYRESGFGREGGREGLWEYVKQEKGTREKGKVAKESAQEKASGISSGISEVSALSNSLSLPEIDRTPKLYIGGKQVRPDSGYSLIIRDAQGHPVGEAGEGNRKDIRNAVEAARTAANSWGTISAHNRAQILYYLAENLQTREQEFVSRLLQLTGTPLAAAKEEFALSLERIVTSAAWTDKYEGQVHRTATRNVTLAMPEPLGVLGIVCPDEMPLLAFLSYALPAVAMGNTIIIVPSERCPLLATDLYQVLETSDIPSGVWNIVTGRREVLAQTLAEHSEVDGIWYAGTAAGSAAVEKASAGNMKRTFVNYGKPQQEFLYATDSVKHLLREATNVKNIWVPYTDEVSW